MDGKGDLQINEKYFSTFRIGIRDGSEEKNGKDFAAGKELVFIARGEGADGKAIWFPAPGPNAAPSKDKANPEGPSAYEFLMDRKHFETLSSRYK